MVYEDKLNDERYERVKKNIGRFSYVDLVLWVNEMIACGAVNNRVFELLNEEIRRRADELKNYKGNKSK